MLSSAEVKLFCKSLPPLNKLKQLHSILITTAAADPNSGELTQLLSAVAVIPPPYGDLSYASALFNNLPPPRSAHSWNAIIRAQYLHSLQEKSLHIYSNMLREKSFPNHHTFPLLLRSSSKTRERNPDQMHAQIFKFGFDSDPFVANALVSGYANGGYLSNARKVFVEMLHRDSVSWTAVIHGCVKNGEAEQGLRFFTEMRLDGVGTDELVVASVLTGAGLVGNVWFGRCVHGFYVLSGRVRLDLFVLSALVDMYGKCGYCDDGRQVFDEMSLRNVVTWTALISGYVNCKRFVDALSVFHYMLTEGIKPNEVTLTSILTASAQLGSLAQGRWVHKYIESNKLEVNQILGTALIDMYAKCGCVDEAVELFNSMQQKEVHHWTVLINGLAKHGRSRESLNLFSQMTKENVWPNKVTFVGILSACSHGGLVDEGRTFFHRMYHEYGIKPSLEHYGCMVDLLGRAGHFQGALHLIESMPMEPTATIWGALFGACIIHRYYTIGEMIGKHLVTMQPEHGGQYSLLANMHSLSRKWEEAANVRMAMKGGRTEKTPGWSWIELNGDLHEFRSMDISNHQTKDIYEALDRMNHLMKLQGCIPDLDIVNLLGLIDDTNLS